MRATKSVSAVGSGVFDLIDNGIYRAFPGFGPTESVTTPVVFELGVLEGDDRRGNREEALECAEGVDGPGGFPVVVFVFDSKAGGGGVEDDEIGLVGGDVGGCR